MSVVRYLTRVSGKLSTFVDDRGSSALHVVSEPGVICDIERSRSCSQLCENIQTAKDLDILEVLVKSGAHLEEKSNCYVVRKQ